jgi:hypothetical protein
MRRAIARRVLLLARTRPALRLRSSPTAGPAAHRRRMAARAVAPGRPLDPDLARSRRPLSGRRCVALFRFQPLLHLCSARPRASC